jgi:hypothetical protein
VSLVLDPSLALSWYFEDERTAEADALLDRVVEEGAVVPALWRLEIANGLQMAMRRKRIDAVFRDNAPGELVGNAPRWRSASMEKPTPMPGARRRACPISSG